MVTALETAPAPLEVRPTRGVSLFWRTFFFLTLLLTGCIIAWLQTFRALEYEPRALQSAQQLASLVNLSRAALIHSDSIARVSLIKNALPEAPVLIGSGVTPETVSETLAVADGAIVGTVLMRDGQAGAGIDPERAAALTRALRGTP